MWFKRDLTSIRWIFMSLLHYNDVIMSTMASQITSLTIVYSTAYSGADQRKHQSSASLAFVRGIHRWPVNSPHKGPVTREMFPFDDVIMAKDDDLLEKRRCMSVSSDCASTVYQWPIQPYHGFYIPSSNTYKVKISRTVIWYRSIQVVKAVTHLTLPIHFNRAIVFEFYWNLARMWCNIE